VKETATTPYLIRAIYEWCCDNGLTPYVAVKVDETTKVPTEYVKNGEIVLNVSPDATRNLKIGNDRIQFSARFGGTSREISVRSPRWQESSPRKTGMAWRSRLHRRCPPRWSRRRRPTPVLLRTTTVPSRRRAAGRGCR